MYALHLPTRQHGVVQHLVAEDGLGGRAHFQERCLVLRECYRYLFSVSLPDRYLWMTLDSSV